MENQKTILESDERIFTIRDCVDLFKKKRKKIFQCALFSGCLVFGLLLLKIPQYQVEATFKEGGEKEGGGGLSDLLSSLGSSKPESQMIILMKSQPVLKILISKLGLQAIVPEKGRFIKYYRRIRDNIRANGQKPLEDIDSFVFQNLVYEGLDTLSFSMRFLDRERFILFKDGHIEMEGKVGQEIELPSCQFTLILPPQNLRIGRDYELNIVPWFHVSGDICSRLKINPNKLNSSILDLSYTARDRHQATRILSAWMDAYLEYLKKNHEEIDQQQLGYLGKRQQQMYDHLSAAFDDYGQYLSENLKSHGLLGLEQEMERTLEPLYGMSKKVLELNVELSRLEQTDRNDPFCSLPDEKVISMSEELQELQQQRDLISISLEQRRAPLIAQSRLEDLKEIRAQKQALEQLHSQIEDKTSITSHFAFEPNQALADWAVSLQPAHEQERKDFSAYLEKYIRILGVKEKIQEARFFHPQESLDELEGVDLDTAKTLFVNYNHELEKSEMSIRHYELFKEELQRSDFEFGSLSSVLKDAVSQKLIEQASLTMMQLKDEKHRSVKEGERWQEELELQKKILEEHLEQLLKVEEVNNSLLRNKINALRQIMLDCVNQKISVIQESFSDYVKDRKKILLNEKALLEEKIKELKVHAATLPESWRGEKWLDLKVKFSIKMMEAITEMVEAKTIGHHLYRIDSKPINVPILPALAVVPKLYFKSFAAATSAGVAFFFFVLLSAIFKGFPTSSEKLKAMKFPFVGELSTFSDGALFESLIGPDLELLRQLTLFLKKEPEHKVIGLLAGKGPDYSYALAENLARISQKSLLVRCDFNSQFHIDDQPGLLQFLKGEITDLPLRKKNGFDYITSGGYTPFGFELIQSEPFQAFLAQAKKEYDYVFLLFRSPFSASESHAVLHFCDRAIVTVCGEPTELLTPFSTWGYDRDNQRVMFITSRIS